MDKDEIKVADLYGNARMSCQNPSVQGVIKGPPEPKNWMEATEWALLGLWREVILPAFIFALGFASFVTLLRF